MSTATVVVTEAQYSLVITDDGGATTVVTPPTAVSLTISTLGPAGPPGPGVPIGGVAGDLLVKSSATNYDTAWTSTPAASITDITETKQVIASDYTIATGKNGLSVSPVEVAAGYTVTVPAGAVWLIAD